MARFLFKNAIESEPARAARIASVYSITGYRRYLNEFKSSPIRSGLFVQSLWLKWVNSLNRFLTESANSDLLSHKSIPLNFMKACLPATFNTKPIVSKSRINRYKKIKNNNQDFDFFKGKNIFCKREDICPWCYARYIANLWSKIYSHSKNDLTLFFIRHKKFLDLPVYQNNLDFIVSSSIEKIQHEVWSSSLQAKNIAKANSSCSSGCHWSIIVEPDFKYNCWCVYSRAIYLVPCGYESAMMIPEFFKTRLFSIKSVSPWTNCLGRMFKHPSGFLKISPIFYFQIKSAQANTRLKGSYGILRKSFEKS